MGDRFHVWESHVREAANDVNDVWFTGVVGVQAQH